MPTLSIQLQRASPETRRGALLPAISFTEAGTIDEN
jgi:hypothetical protein